jgi:hypothetical protein
MASGSDDDTFQLGREVTAARVLVLDAGAVTAQGHAGTGAAQTGPAQGADAVVVGSGLVPSMTRGCEAYLSPARESGPRVGNTGPESEPGSGGPWQGQVHRWPRRARGRRRQAGTLTAHPLEHMAIWEVT